MKFTRFEAETSIGYQFIKSKAECKDLVIVFPGRREIGRKPWPEYVIELSSYDVNRLFIVDDISEACSAPFIFLNGEYTLESTVKGLIDKIAAEVNAENIVAAGASGGGSAALYYGIKYNYDIIASSPALYLGDLFMEVKSFERFKFIMGEISDKTIAQLNNVIPESLEKYIGGFTKKAYINFGKDESMVLEKGREGDYIKNLLEKNPVNATLTFADFSDHMECVPWLSRNFKACLDDIFNRN